MPYSKAQLRRTRIRLPDCNTIAVATTVDLGSDGSNAHELFPDGLYAQTGMSWSPDGTRLLLMDHGLLYMTDASGSEPRLVDTGCVSPCSRDSGGAFSNDGTKLVFVRNSLDASGYTDAGSIATLDLASGRVTVLISTADAGGAFPGGSPDGKQRPSCPRPGRLRRPPRSDRRRSRRPRRRPRPCHPALPGPARCTPRWPGPFARRPRCS